MLEQILYFSIITGGILLFLAVWIITVFIVSWDVRRRHVPKPDAYLWQGLPVVLPLFGFFAYWAMRLINRIVFAGDPAFPVSSERVTATKRPAGLEERLATIAATDMIEDQASLQPGPFKDAAGRVSGQEYRLNVIEGPCSGIEFIVHALPVRIGRGSTADIRLDQDGGTSRQHAEIYSGKEGVRIRDLQSTHGTLVNGSLVQDANLYPGDRIRIGFSTMVFGVQGSSR
jgi:hypothetical protein